jgi:hypothetical protein
LIVDIQKAWNPFLQEVELAKNYHMPYLLNGFGGTFHNPLLGYLLRDCDEPGIAFAQDFRFGIKCNDRVTMEISFTRKTHNAGD